MTARGDGRPVDAAAAYLGYVEHVIEMSHDRIGKLHPVSELPTDDRTPPHIYDSSNLMEAFPNTGRVSWRGIPAPVTKFSWWGFRVEESPSWEPDNPRHDQFIVMGQPLPAMEVLDLRDIGDDEAVRQAITGPGLTLAFTPAERVYLWTLPDHWVGPVRMVPHDSSADQWVVADADLHHPIKLAMAAPSIYVAGTTIAGSRRRFHFPHAKGGQQVGHVDWSADDVLLKRVLRDVRKLDKDFTDKLHVSNTLIDHAVDRLKQHPLVSGEPEVVEQRLRRAARLVERLGARVDLALHIEKEVLRLPHFLAELARQVREEADEAVKEAIEASRQDLAEIDGKVTEGKAEEQALWATIMELTHLKDAETTQIEAQRAEIAKEREDLDRHHGEIKLQFEARVQELVKSPGALLADLAILRMVAPGFAGAPAVAAPLPAAPSEVVAARPVVRVRHASPATSSVVPTLEDMASVRAALRASARRRGIPTRALIAVHGSVLGGGLPVLSGPNALAALEGYAEAVTGGALLWVPVSPAMIEPADLLGRPDGRGRFVPHAAGLLDLLLDAHDAGPTGPLRLVVLDGLNRAPVDSYLAPLLDAMASVHSATPRMLVTCHPAALDPDDPYGATLRFPWPPTVLVAGTLAHGPATLPPSASFWDRSTLLAMPHFARRLVDLGTSVPPLIGPADRTAVRASVFRGWQLAPTPSNGTGVRYRDLQDELRGTIELGPDALADRLVATLHESTALTESDAPTLLDVFLARIAPRAHAAGLVDTLRAQCPPVLSSERDAYVAGLDGIASALS